LFERGAVYSVDMRGSAPGTRETDLLEPVNAVGEIRNPENGERVTGILGEEDG
jgi:L-aminopeptidase/D-esterase-like protein